MESSDDVSEKLVMTLSKEFIDELPKIGTAVKNLIAMVIGRSISDPSANLLFGGDYVFTPEIGLACGRCLLQAIQRFELLEPVSWGVSNDQHDDQTGDKRLDDLLKYKCLYDMKCRMTAQHGGKVSAIFGRSYFKLSKSWQMIKSSIALPPLVHSEMFDYFIRHFESSLLLDNNDSSDVMSDSSLVWATDFYDALKQRQNKRKEEAKKRIAIDEKIAARDAEESEWEDSDDENYKNKKSSDADNDRVIFDIATKMEKEKETKDETEKEKEKEKNMELLKGKTQENDHDLD